MCASCFSIDCANLGMVEDPITIQGAKPRPPSRPWSTGPDTVWELRVATVLLGPDLVHLLPQDLNETWEDAQWTLVGSHCREC